MGDFLLESREHLAGIEAQTLTLERDPCNADALNSVFRGFHTIKGLAGFLELWEVQELAHEVETVLDRARNSQLTITPAAIDVILQSADYLRRWLSHLEAQLQSRPSEAPAKDEALLARIRALSAPRNPARRPLELPRWRVRLRLTRKSWRIPWLPPQPWETNGSSAGRDARGSVPKRYPAPRRRNRRVENHKRRGRSRHRRSATRRGTRHSEARDARIGSSSRRAPSHLTVATQGEAEEAPGPPTAGAGAPAAANPGR